MVARAPATPKHFFVLGTDGYIHHACVTEEAAVKAAKERVQSRGGKYYIAKTISTVSVDVKFEVVKV